jgi:hypothetical protein
MHGIDNLLLGTALVGYALVHVARQCRVRQICGGPGGLQSRTPSRVRPARAGRKVNAVAADGDASMSSAEVLHDRGRMLQELSLGRWVAQVILGLVEVSGCLCMQREP